MKKLSLLLGALGGAMAGYVFSNNTLREELAKAKNADEASKILARHLQKDGKIVGKEMQQFVKSDAVQGNVTKAKQYVNTNVKKLKTDLKDMVQKTAAKAKNAATRSTASKPKAPAAKKPAAKSAPKKTQGGSTNA